MIFKTDIIYCQEETAIKLENGEKKFEDYEIPGVDMDKFIMKIKEYHLYPNHYYLSFE